MPSIAVKSLFITQFREHKRFTSNGGNPKKDILAPTYTDSGEFKLVKRGVDDLYMYIQSHAESTDINVLLKRFANGDTSVLNKKQPMYGDFTQFPENYAEMLNVVINGENYFNSLPVEERAKHGNSFAKFLADFDVASRIASGSPVESIVPDAPKTVDDVKEGIVDA